MYRPGVFWYYLSPVGMAKLALPPSKVNDPEAIALLQPDLPMLPSQKAFIEEHKLWCPEMCDWIESSSRCSLSKEQRDSVQSYCGAFWGTAYHKWYLTPAERRPRDDSCLHFDSIWRGDAAAVLPVGAILFRGKRSTREETGQSVMSTSWNLNSALEFTAKGRRVLLVLRITTSGIRALHIPQIIHDNTFVEAEVLLQPGLTLKLERVIDNVMLERNSRRWAMLEWEEPVQVIFYSVGKTVVNT